MFIYNKFRYPLKNTYEQMIKRATIYILGTRDNQFKSNKTQNCNKIMSRRSLERNKEKGYRLEVSHYFFFGFAPLAKWSVRCSLERRQLRVQY